MHYNSAEERSVFSLPSPAFFMMLTLWLKDTLWRVPATAGFYGIFPHNLLVALFAPGIFF